MKIEKGNRISIGKNKWLELENLDNDNLNNLECIDEIIKYDEFWDYLELECMSECCGINAFRFWEKDIKKVTCKLGKQNVLNYLSDVKNEIVKLNAEILISKRLNNLFVKKGFLKLINYLIESIETIKIKKENG